MVSAIQPPRGRALRLRRGVAVAVGLFLFAGFAGLGVWQLQRLTWKLELIARVEPRVHAIPIDPPGPALWPSVTRAADEYRHIQLSGRFMQGKDSFVQAVTVKGPGFWLLTPLRSDTGFVVLVNRGFVPPGWRPSPQGADRRTSPRVRITGLLRMSEPNGAFLRANRPLDDRWYSRDVAEIAQAKGLPAAAPYFIDADATPLEKGWPLGGLTVIHFRNSHVIYAFTWFSLAAMVALWSVRALVEEGRERRFSAALARSPADDVRA
jgi:surfeit locus 1 family protein